MDLLQPANHLLIIYEGIKVVKSMLRFHYESPALGWSMGLGLHHSAHQLWSDDLPGHPKKHH